MPPNWNELPVNATSSGGDDDEIDYFELERAPFFPDIDQLDQSGGR